MVCRALNELDDLAVEARRVLIAMDRQADLVAAARDFPNLTLESFEGKRISFVRRVVATALREPISLALIGHVNYAPLGWLLKKLRPQMRYGVVLYGIEAWQALPYLKRRALQHADFLISISEYTKQMAVEKNGVAADRVYLLPNALEWDGEQVSKGKGQDQTGIRFLSVCRLEESEQYKGVDTVIAALPEVVRQVPGVQYVVVGGGTDLERHRELARTMGVGDRVRFLGFLSDEELRACYRDSDLFIMPSAGEGFGFVFLEAMHYGKAIIAANCTAVPEVITDGSSGLLVEYGNTTQLARAMIRLCRDHDLRQQIGKAGYERLQQNFTFPQFKQKLTEILAAELTPKMASGAQLPAGRSAPQVP